VGVDGAVVEAEGIGEVIGRAGGIPATGDADQIKWTESIGIGFGFGIREELSFQTRRLNGVFVIDEL
jgi:hypothetical protein